MLCACARHVLCRTWTILMHVKIKHRAFKGSSKCSVMCPNPS